MFLVIVINVFSTVAGLKSFQIHLMAIIVINFRFFIDSSGKKFKVLWFMTILFDVTNEHVFKEFVHQLLLKRFNINAASLLFLNIFFLAIMNSILNLFVIESNSMVYKRLKYELFHLLFVSGGQHIPMNKFDMVIIKFAKKAIIYFWVLHQFLKQLLLILKKSLTTLLRDNLPLLLVELFAEFLFYHEIFLPIFHQQYQINVNLISTFIPFQLILIIRMILLNRLIEIVPFGMYK